MRINECSERPLTLTEISDERMLEAKRDAAVLVKILKILEPLTPKQRAWVLLSVKAWIDLEVGE